MSPADRITYEVRAHKWEHGYELEIAGTGWTQSYGLDDAEDMARDYIALKDDISPDSFDVNVRVEGESPCPRSPSSLLS